MTADNSATLDQDIALLQALSSLQYLHGGIEAACRVLDLAHELKPTDQTTLEMGAAISAEAGRTHRAIELISLIEANGYSLSEELIRVRNRCLKSALAQ